MDFIFEVRGDQSSGGGRPGKMQHIFIPYVQKPVATETDQLFGTTNEAAPAMQEEEKKEVELDDLEFGSENSNNEFDASEVCYICKNPRRDHDLFRQDSSRDLNNNN